MEIKQSKQEKAEQVSSPHYSVQKGTWQFRVYRSFESQHLLRHHSTNATIQRHQRIIRIVLTYMHLPLLFTFAKLTIPYH